MGRGRWVGGNRKGETGKGSKGRGRRRGKRRGDFTDGYDEMPGWNEVTLFSLFTRAMPGTPASSSSRE